MFKPLLSLIAVLIAILSLTSCVESNYWNERNMADFINGCESSLNQSIEKAGINPVEELGITVSNLCHCQMTKTIEKFPDGSPNKSELLQSAANAAQACIIEHRDIKDKRLVSNKE